MHRNSGLVIGVFKKTSFKSMAQNLELCLAWSDMTLLIINLVSMSETAGKAVSSG